MFLFILYFSPISFSNYVCISLSLSLPPHQAMLETISTLKFANRAKNIRNEAKVNEDLDQKSLLRKYERELKKLRAELEERSKNVVDKRRLLELDEQVLSACLRYHYLPSFLDFFPSVL